MNKSDVWLGVLNILHVNRAVLSFSFISTFYSFLINFYSLLNVLFWLLCVLFSLSKPEIIERGLIDWLIDWFETISRFLNRSVRRYFFFFFFFSYLLLTDPAIRFLSSLHFPQVRSSCFLEIWFTFPFRFHQICVFSFRMSRLIRAGFAYHSLRRMLHI